MIGEAVSEISSVDLIVPVYLDTNALLDLLASLQDGFSLVEKITTTSATGSETDIGARAEFGIANFLSLLKISTSGEVSRQKSVGAGEARERERYHTYGSLLHGLRRRLLDLDLLRASDWENAEPSDFVELPGLFNPNPLVDSLNTLDRLMAMAALTEAMEDSAPPGKRKQPAPKRPSETEQMRRFFTGLREDLEAGDVRTWIVELRDGSGYRAVTSLFLEYLRDRTTRELAYKEFRLLGKVVRNLSGTSEPVNLLRGTGLGGLGGEGIGELLKGFKEARTEGLNLPDVETEIRPPALEVLPIAIFV